ncbi:hypothetical protein [Peribacillus butanolivorans]|uniref:AsmA-like C-terminal domain-containing protein n=1 Tax=Peribacillus butanolivorans TaxID=421767 RepID=A0ABM6XFZ7_9BACI|nr:hypothetical protein [Peribacillus butanolivorans]AXN37235.1 hypothetical protein DTO10_01685 [Peribacillus butanolivorans]
MNASLNELPSGWEVVSFLPEIKGTVFDTLSSENITIILNSQIPNKVDFNIDTNKNYDIAIDPIKIRVLSLKAQLHVIKEENTERKLDGEISGKYELSGIFEKNKQWNGDMKLILINKETEHGHLLGMIFPQDFSPKVIERGLSPLFKLFNINIKLQDSGLIISSLDNMTLSNEQKFLPSLPLDLKKGATFFSTASLEGSIFKYLEPVFGSLSPVNLAIHFDKNVESSTLVAALATQPSAKGAMSFANIRLLFSPVDESMAIAGTITINIQDHLLQLECAAKLSPDGEQVISFRLPENQRKWENPLGINGVTLEDIAVTLTLAPAEFSFMVQGAISIGEGSSQIRLLAALQLTNGVLPTALYGKLDGKEYAPEGIPLDVLVKAFSIVQIQFPLLRQVLVKYFEFYIGTDPSGIEIEGKRYKGVFLSSDISFFGIGTKFAISFNDQGLKANGSIASPIQIGSILKISDSTGEKGPEVQIDTTNVSDSNQQQDYFYLSSKVTLFNSISDSNLIYIQNNGFSFEKILTIGDISNVRMNCTLQDTTQFTGIADFNFNFPGIQASWNNITLKIGSVSVSTKVTINASPNSFSLVINFSFSFMGHNFIDEIITLDVVISDLNEIKDKVLDYVITKGVETIREIASDPLKFLDKWKVEALEFAEDVGDKLKELFPDKSIDDMAKFFKEANIGASDAFKHLKIPYGINDEALTKSLKDANFSLDDVKKGLEDVAKITNPTAVGNILIGAGFPEADIKILIPDWHIPTTEEVSECIRDPLKCARENLPHLPRL